MTRREAAAVTTSHIADVERCEALRLAFIRNRWRVTFDVVTPESAEHGDSAESGFLDSRGWRVAALIGVPTPGVGMTLREALNLAGGCMEDCGRWFAEIDGRVSYATGAEERRSLHPPESISAASYGRLRRVLGVRP